MNGMLPFVDEKSSAYKRPLFGLIFHNFDEGLPRPSWCFIAIDNSSRVVIIILVIRVFALIFHSDQVTLNEMQCSMSSMQHVARCFEMQRVHYLVKLLSRLQRVALKNMQRVA